MAKWKMQSFELMKVLSDFRRTKILHLAEKPITVKELAEEMDEKPSRLYYHVKKLMDVDLLKVVETKQQGNLVEKYYQATDYKDTIYKGDIQLQSENIPLVLSNMHRVLDPGLQLVEKSLEKVKEEKGKGITDIRVYPYQVSFNTAEHRITAKEWNRVNNQILKALSRDDNQSDDEKIVPDFKEMTPEEETEVGTYVHVHFTYKLEDAIKLGLINEDAEDK